MNVRHLRELPPDYQKQLLDYIDDSYKLGTEEHTAYGLKQHFTSTHPNKDYHVTSECFKEAMEKIGYEAIPITDASEPNWRFKLKLFRPID